MEVSSSTNVLLHLQNALHRPQCYWDCCLTGRSCESAPQFMLTRSSRPCGFAVIWKWHILTNTSMHFCQSNIYIDVMRKITQGGLCCAVKVLPIALRSFCLSSTINGFFSQLNKVLIWGQTADDFSECMYALLSRSLTSIRTARFCLLKKQHSGNFRTDFAINLPKSLSVTFLGWLLLLSLNQFYNFTHIETKNNMHPTFFRPYTIYSVISQLFSFQKLQVLHSAWYFRWSFFPSLNVNKTPCKEGGKIL